MTDRLFALTTGAQHAFVLKGSLHPEAVGLRTLNVQAFAHCSLIDCCQPGTLDLVEAGVLQDMGQILYVFALRIDLHIDWQQINATGKGDENTCA